MRWLRPLSEGKLASQLGGAGAEEGLPLSLPVLCQVLGPHGLSSSSQQRVTEGCHPHMGNEETKAQRSEVPAKVWDGVRAWLQVWLAGAPSPADPLTSSPL